MATLASLLERIGLYTQDMDHTAWPLATKEAQLRDEMTRLARQEVFGAAVWQQVQDGYAEYTFGEETVEFAEVLYDRRSLRAVSELALSRLQRDWDRSSGPPQYYTVPVEPAQTVRLIPTPQHDGPAAAPTPTYPLAAAGAGNLVAFTWENLQRSATEFDLPAMVEDYLVFRTVAALSGQFGEFHDQARAQGFQALAGLILKTLLGGDGG